MWLTAVAAVVFAVIAYWDKLEGCWLRLKDKCAACKLSVSKEAEDFADWDEE